MKILRLIIISAALFVSIILTAQEADKTAVFYDYELVPTGRVLNGTDTLYNVVLVIDTTDAQVYSSIFLENSQVTRQVSVKASDFSSSSRIMIQRGKYHMNMDDWSDPRDLRVKAKKADGREVELKRRPQAEAVVHKVITLGQKRRDLKVFEGGVNEEEEIQE